jgi:hypothetical protein
LIKYEIKLKTILNAMLDFIGILAGKFGGNPTLHHNCDGSCFVVTDRKG